MLLHWCQNTQVTLYPAVIVADNIIPNHLSKLLTACEPSAVIPFPFENAPIALHGTVVNTLGCSGHTLLHLSFLLAIECSVRILEPAVAVNK